MKHLIKIETTEHGALSVSHMGKDQQWCDAGLSVFVNNQPDAGWGLQKLYYVVAGSSEKHPIDIATRTFIMPNGNVTIGGVFKRFVIGDWTEGKGNQEDEAVFVKGEDGEPRSIPVDQFIDTITDAELDNDSERPVQNKVVMAALGEKQDNLVSGQNIKTLNGESLLGNGNIVIEQHFKGWWPDLDTLKDAITAVDGDYAYVADPSPATTTSIYVYDEDAATDNYWSDSGRDVDTSDVNTFESGEALNEVSIIDDVTTGGEHDVLSAEQGKALNEKIEALQDGSISTKAELSFVDEDDNCIAQFKDGHIKTKNFDSKSSVPEIVLPDKITAVVGDTLQLFFKSIIDCPDYENYGVNAVCSVGRSYPRYYEVTPTNDDVGSKTLTIYVYGANMEAVAAKSVTLEIVAKATSPLSNKNILLVGASTLASGVITPEVKRRLTLTSGNGTPANPTGLGLSNVTFIGRKSIAATATLPEVNQEATGGYGWQIYATNALKMHRFYVTGVSAVNLGDTYEIQGVPIPSGVGFLRVIEVNITSGTGDILCEVNGGAIYSSVPDSGTLVKRSGSGDATISYNSTVEEEGNPFWHDGAVDFKHYSTTYCNGADIDILITHIGLNGSLTTSDVDTWLEAYCKPFIRKFHTDYPSGKFVLGTMQLGSPDGGYGSLGYANVKSNWWNISKVYWYILKKYQEIASSSEFSSYVSLCEITPEFDCENGYPTTTKAVNNRVATTEVIQSNQIHPTDDGKKLIADSIYRTLNKIL